MVHVFGENIVISNPNTSPDIALNIRQTGNNEGLQVHQFQNKIGVRIMKHHIGNVTCLAVINKGSGYGVYVDQVGPRHALAIVNKVSGDGVNVIQKGEGHGIHIHKEHTGNNNALSIRNDGTGKDIVGHNANWHIDKDGNATLNDVHVNGSLTGPPPPPPPLMPSGETHDFHTTDTPGLGCLTLTATGTQDIPNSYFTITLDRPSRVFATLTMTVSPAEFQKITFRIQVAGQNSPTFCRIENVDQYMMSGTVNFLTEVLPAGTWAVKGTTVPTFTVGPPKHLDMFQLTAIGHLV